MPNLVLPFHFPPKGDASAPLVEADFNALVDYLTNINPTSGTVNTGTQFQLAYYATSTNAVSGLTLITPSKALVSNASGLPIASVTSAAELAFVNGVTSAIQTQIDLKAPKASPTFTGTVTMPTPFTLGAVSVTTTGTEFNFVAGVTSGIQAQLNLKAPLASPTFTGVVTIPTPFTLGAVSVTATGTELNYSVGVTSLIQTQLNAKATDSLVVHLAGAESITGAKTFDSSTLLLKETGGGTDTITIATPSLAASRTYSFLDAGAAANFVMSEGTATINGSKTFADFRGTFGADIAAGSHKITGLTNGSAAADAAAYGQLKILQVVSATSTTNQTTTSNAYQTSNLSASITLASTSNKVMVVVSGVIKSDAPQTAAAIVSIFRGSTDLSSAANGFAFANSSVAGAYANAFNITYLDSPASVSALTYAVKLKNDDNATTVRFGNSAMQSMILLEVAG